MCHAQYIAISKLILSQFCVFFWCSFHIAPNYIAVFRARGSLQFQVTNLVAPCGAKAMKNRSLTPPYNPPVRSNRDLANFYCNVDVAWPWQSMAKCYEDLNHLAGMNVGWSLDLAFELCWLLLAASQWWSKSSCKTGGYTRLPYPKAFCWGPSKP